MLTGSGRTLGVLAIAALIGGALLDYPELVAIGLACLLAILTAAGWMLLRPKLVAVREIRPIRVEAGGAASGVLTLTNEGRRRGSPATAVEHVAGRRIAVALPSLGPGKVGEATYPLPTDRRGVFRVGPLTIGHSDPLRLMFAAKDFASTSMLTVYPRTHAVSPLPTGQARDADGPTSSDAPRGGIAFHMLREYVPGDDRRLIHWPSTAKTGTLMVRHNVVPNEPRLMVVLDTSIAPYQADRHGANRNRVDRDGDEAFEDAVRVAASLCVAACDAGYPLTFRTTGGLIAEFERGSVGRGSLLDTLAAVQCDPGDPGLRQLPQLVPGQHDISLGVVTGQAPDDQRAAVSASASRFRMVTLIQVGERYGRPAVAERGIFAINVSTSEDFASTWNRKVPR